MQIRKTGLLQMKRGAVREMLVGQIEECKVTEGRRRCGLQAIETGDSRSGEIVLSRKVEIDIGIGSGGISRSKTCYDRVYLD
jgi:hypothetical protein